MTWRLESVIAPKVEGGLIVGMRFAEGSFGKRSKWFRKVDIRFADEWQLPIRGCSCFKRGRWVTVKACFAEERAGNQWKQCCSFLFV